MTAVIRVVGMREPIDAADATVVNTTSRASTEWEQSLSPFHLGPCRLTGGDESRLMENAWQFSKLYAVHTDVHGEPTGRHWSWARAGWAASRANRFPMGRGARPLCALWAGERLGYVAARKRIFGPLYAEAVQRTAGWERLRDAYDGASLLVLRDFDGYDHTALGLDLRGVLNEPARRMGHAFVLAMLLQGDPALAELDLRV